MVNKNFNSMAESSKERLYWAIAGKEEDRFGAWNLNKALAAQFIVGVVQPFSYLK